jgi:hypothetical protein
MFPALLLGPPLNLSPTLTLKEVDLLLLTGDITDAGQSEEWRQFFELMDPVLLHKTIIIPGNHDLNLPHSSDLDAMEGMSEVLSQDPPNTNDSCHERDPRRTRLGISGWIVSSCTQPVDNGRLLHSARRPTTQDLALNL